MHNLSMSHAAAASLPDDLSGAILDHLRQLDLSGRAVIRWANTGFVGPTAGKFQRVAANIQLTLVANSAMRQVVRNTNSALETLIWLRGMKATIEDSDDELAERIGELLPAIETLQETMQTLRVTIRELKDAIAGVTKSPSLRAQRVAVFHKYLAVEADTFAALEDARWATLEREADADILAGRVGKSYTSAAELIADLTA
jgi:hypothetical protein